MTTAPPIPSKSDRIARLFLAGNSLDRISEQGVLSGWTRAEAERVAAERGWALDSLGRIPHELQQKAVRPSAGSTGQQPRPARLPRSPGGPYVAAINGNDVFVDHTYQRPLDQGRVERMAAEWSPRMLGVLDVSDRGDAARPRYAVINGQHRVAAAKAAGARSDLWLVCNVHEGLTVEGEAELMYELDKATKPLTSWDKWRARGAAGDPVVLAVEKVAKDNGMAVHAAAFGAVGAAERLVRVGGEQLLAQTAAALVASFGAVGESVKAPLLTGLGGLFQLNGSELDMDRLVAALRKSSPHEIRAHAEALRQVEGGKLSTAVGYVIAGLYNRGAGPRISSGRS